MRAHWTEQQELEQLSKVNPSLCSIEGWAFVAAVAVSAGAAAYSASQSSAAAQDQVNAAQNQIQLQQAEFNQIQQNEAPWLAAGANALGVLQAGFAPGGQYTTALNQIGDISPGAFQSSPAYAGYQFQQEAGSLGVREQAAALGKSYAPATAEALAEFNQGLAATSYGNWYNQFLQGKQTQFQALNAQISGQEQMAAYGQNANQLVASAGQNITNQEAAAWGSIGNARAAGALGQAQAVNAGVGTIAGAYGNYQQGAYGNYQQGQQFQNLLQNQYYSSLFNPNQGPMSSGNPAGQYYDPSTQSGPAPTAWTAANFYDPAYYQADGVPVGP